MHRLLQRQLKRQFGALDKVPEELRPLFEQIDAAYGKADDDLALVSHSLDEMSRELNERNDALRRERDEQAALAKRLEQAHNQLLQAEKMASIGQLAAGVAHEINNPIGYVNSNLKTLDGYVDDLLAIISGYEAAEDELPHHRQGELSALKRQIDIGYLKDDVLAVLRESREGVDRVKKIVQDLKDFSHPDQGVFVWANLHRNLDSTLNIVANEIKYKADVVKDYGDLPDIECLPSQLNQVFMNLLVNAAQAMPGDKRGTITIRTRRDGDEGACIEIADNGAGISSENLSRIFDPFFTTKPVGQGTGLGLSLSYGIVQKHQGRIEVDSLPGLGTCFRIYLPIRCRAEPTGGAGQDKPEAGR